MAPHSVGAAATGYPSHPVSPAMARAEMAPAASALKIPLRPGVYVPTLCFFHPATEELDLAAVAAHAVRLAAAGVAGLVTQGSTGEAVHLTHEERRLVTSATRAALDAAGYAHLPVLVGCGAQSTRETVMLCADAARSGGSYALVLPPAYNAAMLSRAALLAYFEDVADVSPLPVLVYNYPAVTAGTDLSSADIVRLAAHPNIVGCKLTCGNTGKLGRIAAATRAATAEDAGSGFMCMGGSADFTLPTLAAGGSGIISGLANVTPKACVELYRAGVQGDRERARAAQAVVARGDWAAIQGGIVGCKAALMRYFGYGGFGRRPLPRGGKATAGMGEWDEVVAFEKKL